MTNWGISNNSKPDFDFVFVTACPATYTMFYSVLKENQVNKQVFDFYFRSWVDLYSLVNCVDQSRTSLLAHSTNQNKETLEIHNFAFKHYQIFMSLKFSKKNTIFSLIFI